MYDTSIFELALGHVDVQIFSLRLVLLNSISSASFQSSSPSYPPFVSERWSIRPVNGQIS